MGRINITRYAVLSFFILAIVASITPILLAYDLLALSDYASFSNLLDVYYMDYNLFANVVIANLDYGNVNGFKIIYSIIDHLSWFNWGMILLVGYLWAAYNENEMRGYQLKIKLIISLYLLTYVLIAILLMIGTSITTLHTIIVLFQGVGAIMFLGHIFIIVFSIYSLWNIKKTFF